MRQPNRLREFRVKRRMTQQHLARLAGVARQTISRIESGYPASDLTQQALADALGTQRKRLFPDELAEAAV